MRALEKLLVASLLVAACSSPSAEPGSVGSAPIAAAPSSVGPLQVPRSVDRAQRASEGLAQLKELALGSPGRQLGLQAADVSDATLGDEIPVYAVTADAIDERSEAPLGEPREILLPVMVRGEAVSAVTMNRNASGEWEVVSVGRAPLARSVDQTKKALAARGVTTPIALAMSRELGLRLIARQEQSGLVFTAFAESGSVGLPVGKDVHWSEVSPALRRVAARYVAPSK